MTEQEIKNRLSEFTAHQLKHLCKEIDPWCSIPVKKKNILRVATKLMLDRVEKYGDYYAEKRFRKLENDSTRVL